MSEWRRPASCDTASCPEVLIGLTDVAVRSSERPDMVAVFSNDEWRALAAAIEEFAVGD